MFIATALLAALLALGFAVAAVPKTLALASATENARQRGYSVRAYRIIGLLELAGAAGVIIGLWWAPLGVAAAAGLVMVMVGASREHIIAEDEPRYLVRAVAFGVTSAAVLALRLVTA
ncbi:DoxX family protein [Streptomyces hokutonensis]|uniref:DoxX family protein n=1 Tax=Streptomyces hokutonensis TaxID=1306990 RepID=UPI00380908CA